MFIYKIENTITGQLYIGKTTQSVKTRWSQHKSRGRSIDERTTKHSYKLYKDMKIYGIDKFVCSTIDVANSIEELAEKEKYYIEHYDSINNGYNLVYGDIVGGTVNEEQDKHNRKVISLGVKHYWSEIDSDKRSEIARSSMHSIPSEDRVKYIKNVWNSMDTETKSRRIAKTVNTRLLNDKDKGNYTLISPDGTVYNSIFNLTDFCVTHGLKRNCVYHLIKGNQKSYKGWTVTVNSSPKKNLLKKYKFMSPTGDVMEIVNISTFCREYSLSEGSIRCMIRGVCKQHKGWKLIDMVNNYNE